jgi:hypothetical protein
LSVWLRQSFENPSFLLTRKCDYFPPHSQSFLRGSRESQATTPF